MNSSISETPIDIWPLVVKTKKVFEFYCQFGERMNLDRLKSFRFVKLVSDAEIPIDKTEVEIIYKSENKSNTMNFNQFLNTIVKFAMIVNKTEHDKKTKVFNFISKYLLPLYNEIDNTATYNPANQNVDDLIRDVQMITMISKSANIFYDIYKVYFPHEISICDAMQYIKSESKKQFFIFLKDFDLFPSLISKSNAFAVYQSETSRSDVDDELNKNKNFYFSLIKKIDLERVIKIEGNNSNILGQFFNFFKFLRTLVKIADFSYKKVTLSTKESNDYNRHIKSIHDKFSLLLKQIENSPGFDNIEKKTNRTHSTKKFDFDRSEFIADESTMAKTKRTLDEIVIGRSFAGEESEVDLVNYHNDYCDLVFHTDYIEEKYGNDLKKVFLEICQRGNVANRTMMTSTGFHRFVVEYCDLVSTKKINENDIDVIFVKLALSHRENNNNSTINIKQINNSALTLDFKLFIMSIEILVIIAYKTKGVIDNRQTIDSFISKHILPKIKRNSQQNLITNKVDFVVEFLQRDNNKKFWENVKNSLLPLFKYFTLGSDVMIFPQFLTFSKEFEIFPKSISFTFINEAFHNLNLLFGMQVEGVEVIDFEHFALLICLIALELKFPNEKEIIAQEKILFFIDKLSISKGIENMINKGNFCGKKLPNGQTWKLNDNMKKEYPERYKAKQVQKDTFVNIFS